MNTHTRPVTPTEVEALNDAEKRKFLRFSNEKSIFFLNIFTIFNQLYNFSCLHNLCNGKKNTKMA
jgi:hypothetical protein